MASGASAAVTFCMDTGFSVGKSLYALRIFLRQKRFHDATHVLQIAYVDMHKHGRMFRSLFSDVKRVDTCAKCVCRWRLRTQ